MFRDPITLNPEEFERKVQRILEASGAQLDSFRTSHREKINGADGVYEIDVTARFRALGADFLVLAECKHQKNPIKRDAVQLLRDRMQSLGAHKGILFTTTTFQTGAIKYAGEHGIALVRVTEWDETWVKFSERLRREPSHVRKYAYWLTGFSKDGHEHETRLFPNKPGALISYIKGDLETLAQ